MESGPGDLLQRGIAAAKAGQREVARKLLTQAAEQDERSVAAWLWLSSVVDNLDDREVCLENVLTLDSANQMARKGLDWVREQKAAAPSVYTPPLMSESYASSAQAPLSPAAAMFRKKTLPEPEPPPPPPVETLSRLSADAWVAPSPEVQEEAAARLAEFDDEYLCPYCAQPTQPEDKTCKACHGKLWRYERRLPEGSYWFWMLLGYLVITAMARVYWMSLSLFNSIGPMFGSGELSLEQFVGLYLGLNPLPPEVAAKVLRQLPPAAFWSFAITVSVQLGLAVLIYWRWQPIYWLLVGLAGIFTLFALAQVFLSYSLTTALGLLAAAAPVVILLRISEDFMKDRERLLCAPDRGVRTHSGFYARGREYARQGVWVLAVIHLRRAVAGAPTMVAYHLALARAYAGLRRYERAESVWREAQRFAPDHPDLRAVADLIAAVRAQEQGAKRSTA